MDPVTITLIVVAGVIVVGGIAYLIYKGVQYARARGARERTRDEQAALPDERAQQATELAGLREQKEAKMADQSAARDQKEREVNAATGERERKVERSEAVVDEKARKNEKQEKITGQKLPENKEIEKFIDNEIIRLGVQTMNSIKRSVSLMLKIPGVSLEQIKSSVKEDFPDVELFFEDELRDPITDELLDDCVLGLDGRRYNRSTLADTYDPAELKTDEALRTKIQLLREAGLLEGLSLPASSPEPVHKKIVSETPMLIEQISLQNKTFLKAAKEGYLTLFIPRQKPPVSAEGKPHPLEPAIVIGRQVTAGAAR